MKQIMADMEIQVPKKCITIDEDFTHDPSGLYLYPLDYATSEILLHLNNNKDDSFPINHLLKHFFT